MNWVEAKMMGERGEDDGEMSVGDVENEVR